MTGSPSEPTTHSAVVGRKRCRRNAIKPNSVESDLLREFAVTHQMGGVTVSETVSETVSVSVTEVEASASISKQTDSGGDSDSDSDGGSPSIDRSSSAEVEEVDSPSPRSSSVPFCAPEANNESSACPLEREAIDGEEEEERGAKKKRVDRSVSDANNRDEQ